MPSRNSRRKSPPRARVPARPATSPPSPQKSPDPAALKRHFQLIEGNKSRRRRRILVTVCVIVVVLVVLAAVNAGTPGGLVERAQNTFAGMGGGGGYPVAIPSGSFVDAQLSGNTLNLVTSNAAAGFSQSGRQLFNRTPEMDNPALAANNFRTLLYDRGGSSLWVQNNTGVLYQRTFTGRIVTAALGEDGAYAVVVDSSDHASQVYVFDRNNRQLDAWQPANVNIGAVAVAAGGDNFAAVGVSEKDGAIVSTVYVMNAQKSDPVAQEPYAGSMIYTLDYKADGRIFGVADNLCLSLSGKGTDARTYSYDGMSLCGISRADENDTALLLQNTGGTGGQRVAVLSGEAGLAGQFDVTEQASGVALSGGNVFLQFTGSVARYNLSGKQTKSWNVDGNVLRIVADASDVFAVSFSQVQLLS